MVLNAPTMEDIERQASQRDLDKQYIRDGVYDMLPELLRKACNVFERKIEREVFLMSALPVCATLMRGAKIVTRKGPQGLNLAVWIYSDAGIGKGVAGMADTLLDAVKAEAMARYNDSRMRYEDDLDAHRTRLTLIKKQRTEAIEKGQHELPPLPQAPPPPPREDISLPLYGNVKSIRDEIEQNGGQILFFDTEADSLSMSSGEYGDLRIIIKQGIENEKSGQLFKTTGLKEWRSYISLMIAATDDQLVKFIKRPQDGLFSRFLFYGFKDTQEWVSSEPSDRPDYTSQLEAMQGAYASLYDRVRDAAPTVHFLPEQWRDHTEMFTAQKANAIETHTALAGSVHRLGQFMLRIAAILTIMREHRGNKQMPRELTCDKHSWTAARHITLRFFRGLYEAWGLFQPNELPTDKEGQNIAYEKAHIAAANEARRLKEEGLTLCQVHDSLLSDKQLAAFTCRWSGKMSKNTKKQRVSRLVTFIQR